jgi:hypothetical protein
MAVQCNFLSGLTTHFKYALAPGSSDLERLPKWPDRLHVQNLAGDISVSKRIDMWSIHEDFDKQTIGDFVVGLESATAEHQHEEEITLHCHIDGFGSLLPVNPVNLTRALNSTCFHTNLFTRIDVQDAIVDFVKRNKSNTLPGAPSQSASTNPSGPPPPACPVNDDQLRAALRSGNSFPDEPGMTIEGIKCIGDYAVADLVSKIHDPNVGAFKFHPDTRKWTAIGGSHATLCGAVPHEDEPALRQSFPERFSTPWSGPC